MSVGVSVHPHIKTIRCCYETVAVFTYSFTRAEDISRRDVSIGGNTCTTEHDIASSVNHEEKRHDVSESPLNDWKQPV
jgi:hypothetical protein